VAGGRTGGANSIFYSTDGISWGRVNDSGSNLQFPNKDVAYGGGKWVAVGGAGEIAYSADGVLWQWVNYYTQMDYYEVHNIAYGEGGKWVLVGGGGISGAVLAYSTDVTSWDSWHLIPWGNENGTTTTFGNNDIRDIAYENGRWVAVGDNGKMAYADW
jgi:hypothetical protein